VALVAVAGVLPARPARAVPIDEPQVGGIGFSGPTTGDLAAVYWNPAAVGLIHGLRLTVTGTATVGTTTVTPSAVDPATGMPFAPARSRDRFQPLVWPLGPGGFAGIGYDVGGDRFTLALASYMPFLERASYQTPGADPAALATRYHRISTDLRNLALVSALSIRFAGDFRLGFSSGALFSTGRLSFAESTCAATACPESPGSDTRADLGSDLGIFSSSFAFTLGGGAYYRQRAWEFGASFASRPLGEVAGSAVIAGDKSHLSRPIGVAGGVATCTNGTIEGDECVFRIFADVVYRLPHTITGAVAWHPRPGWELAAIGRMLIFPDGTDAVDIRLTGTSLGDAGVPAHIVLHRGYGTVVDTRLRAAFWVNERLRLGAGFRFEGSALGAGDISPAAVDGRKVQPTAMISFRPVKFLWLGAGYGFTYMFPVTADGRFQPGAAAACAENGGDLQNPSCVQLREGYARPSAAGRYTSVRHDITLSLSAQF
jgi:hypothetical protein